MIENLYLEQMVSVAVLASFQLILNQWSVWAMNRSSSIGNASHAQVIVGKDTRLSGYMLESALEAGLISSGVNVVLTGPLPTPAIGYLTETLRADLGIVISASHNPYKDNGIKLVLPNGEKLGKQACWEIEQYLYSQLKMDPMAAIGKASRLPGAAERYAERCKSRLIHTKDLQQMKIVIDCANGATYQIAKLVFQELHAQVVCINDKPDGKHQFKLWCGRYTHACRACCG